LNTVVTHDSPQPWRRALYVALGACLLAAVGVALWGADDVFGFRAAAPRTRALAERGRVAVVHSRSLADMRVEGTLLVPAENYPLLTQALAGEDGTAVVHALQAAGLRALLVEPRDAPTHARSVEARLLAYQSVPGLRCVFLDAASALYVADPVAALSESERMATAVVARRLLSGERLPRLSSFPASLRAMQPVEVMVLLRQGGRARLWRSARGNSMASALMTASTVARERWRERQQVMGGAIDALLPRMDVEVALLSDDGTVGEQSAAFIDRVFLASHGVAYERKGAWRYFLPEATQFEGKGRPSVAYRKLFADDGLVPDSFNRSDLRMYRLIVQTLAVSNAMPPRPDALSPVRDPDEILGAAPR
jgi:hypothetical protein